VRVKERKRICCSFLWIRASGGVGMETGAAGENATADGETGHVMFATSRVLFQCFQLPLTLHEWRKTTRVVYVSRLKRLGIMV
jgi:hypothetical protein